MKQELKIPVDLDAEKGATVRPDHPNTHRVVIRKTSAINLAAVKAYLEGKMSFDNSVLEAISELPMTLVSWYFRTNSDQTSSTISSGRRRPRNSSRSSVPSLLVSMIAALS